QQFDLVRQAARDVVAALEAGLRTLALKVNIDFEIPRFQDQHPAYFGSKTSIP
ncbi:MAG: hypothetical protein GY830_01455, partial [Bacteroidetes bacterium]|nr:hypothetical protein [Bacteroidota bacterium]